MWTNCMHSLFILGATPTLLVNPDKDSGFKVTMGNSVIIDASMDCTVENVSDKMQNCIKLLL